MQLGTLQEYIDRTGITAHYSPCGSLVLFDYNKMVSFTRDWDNLTRTARGLVFNVATGKVASRSFDKFYNLDEPEVGGYEKLPPGEITWLEKADGSMIECFYSIGRWWFTTRGSFNSDQAIWAEAWASTHLNFNMMSKVYTFIFECIYPENRIVVDYGDTEELRLTGIRHIESGEFLSYATMEYIAALIKSNIVKRFTFSDIHAALASRETLTINEEGYVGRIGNFMFKLKGNAYCLAHKAMSNMTPLAFWDAIDIATFKIPESFLSQIPEEFRSDVDALAGIVEKVHQDIIDKTMEYAASVPVFDSTTADGKKSRYLYISNNFPSGYVHRILSVVNNNSMHVRNEIHRAVRPNYNKFNGVTLSKALQRFIEEAD